MVGKGATVRSAGSSCLSKQGDNNSGDGKRNNSQIRHGGLRVAPGVAWGAAGDLAVLAVRTRDGR
jgi:hypothetical protein